MVEKRRQSSSCFRIVEQLKAEQGKLFKLLARCFRCNSTDRIHDLRVHCRKFEAACELVGPALKKQILRRIVKTVSKIRKATNALRDLTIALELIRRHRELFDSEQYRSLKSALKKQSNQEYRSFICRLQMMERRGNLQKLKKLHLRFREGIDMLDVVRRQMLSGVSDLQIRANMLQLPASHRKKDWHQFRIKAKLVRYQIEFATIFLQVTMFEKLGHELATIQDRIGQSRDVEQLRKLLRRISNKSEKYAPLRSGSREQSLDTLQADENSIPSVITQSLMHSLAESSGFLLENSDSTVRSTLKS